MGFKSEYSNCVPLFDRNYCALNRCISTSVIIITNNNRQNVNNFQHSYTSNSFISKLSNNAKFLVNSQKCSNWKGLQFTLYRKFSDQRDETSLNRNLVLLRPNITGKVYHFHNKILEILNDLCGNIDIHEQTGESKQILKNLCI